MTLFLLWFGSTYVSNLTAGNSTLAAVFDAPFGERITALSSQLDCRIQVEGGAASGRCAVPLTSFIVDTEATKTDHFYQWATNKKMDVTQCVFELTFADVRVDLVASTSVPFAGKGRFRLCGRSRDADEALTGQVVRMPAGTMGPTETLRVRVTLSGFDREAYQIGPAWTDGWLARVQQLAPVVAKTGEIHVNLFAKLAEPTKENP
jgi:hypothetical protein